MRLKMLDINKMLVVGISVSLMACGGDSADKKDLIKEAVEAAPAAEEEVEVEVVEEFDFILPSPLQTAAILKKSGLTYQDGLTNDPKKADEYSTKLSQSLNFGIYSADLSYCILNNHAQDGLKYMQAVKSISDKLGMGGVLGDQALYESFERNLGVEDSMINILATVQGSLDEYIEDNDQAYTGLIIFTGAWIEGMYLGAEVNSDASSNLAKRLIEQTAILSNIIKGVNTYPNASAEFDDVKKTLISIQASFDNIADIKAFNNDELEFEEVKVTDEELKAITDQVKALRAKIVNG